MKHIHAQRCTQAGRERVPMIDTPPDSVSDTNSEGDRITL